MGARMDGAKMRRVAEYTGKTGFAAWKENAACADRAGLMRKATSESEMGVDHRTFVRTQGD